MKQIRIVTQAGVAITDVSEPFEEATLATIRIELIETETYRRLTELTRFVTMRDGKPVVL